MKNTIHASKRGFAIESAIIILLIATALCMLTVTLCIALRGINTSDTNGIKTRVEVDNIAESFCADPDGFDCAEVADFTAVKSADCRRLCIYDGDCLLLTVEVNDGGEVIKWQR